jgi:hypothetical protein
VLSPVERPGAQAHGLLRSHADDQRSRKGAAVRLQWCKCCRVEQGAYHARAYIKGDMHRSQVHVLTGMQEAAHL